MKLGTTIPTLGPTASPEAVRDLSQAADELGFEAIWAGDHLAVPRRSASMYVMSADGKERPVPDGALASALRPLYECLATLSFVAGLTKRVKVGSAICVLPIRNPLLNARQLATIDALSRGRLIVGIGSGWLEEEAHALQVPWDKRGVRTDEHIKLLRTVWTAEGDYVSFSGRFYSFEEIATDPRPAQTPPPILIGGHSPAALRRAGRLGDGWLASNVSADAVAGAIAEIKRIAADAGRDPDSLTFVTATTAAIDSSGRLVAPRINPQRRGMTGQPPDPDPPALLETLQSFSACDQVIVQPDAETNGAMTILRRIAEEIVPALAD